MLLTCIMQGTWSLSILLSAVQTSVLPILLGAPSASQLYTPFAPPQDVCVSAPTGSGKTLSYVIPIIEVRTL